MTPLVSSALLRAQSDDRLVALAAAGHDRAFEAIVERYRRPLMRYLRRLLSETLAEDVVQATFINAWSSLRGGTEVRELRPWLYRIAHNAAINALKKVGEAMEEVPESAGGFATEPAAELERRDEMLHALNSIAALPSRQRTALLAVAVDGRAHAEVAEELGLTDGAVRQLVHRARTTLRTAATACTPAPLLHAVLASAGDSTVARVAEVAAGAGGAGAASVSLKAGAAAVLATGALVSGGPEVAKVVHPSQQGSAAGADIATPLSPSSGPGGGGPFTTPAVAPMADPSGPSGPSASSGHTTQSTQSGRTHRQRRNGRDADSSRTTSSSSGRGKRTAAADRRGRRDATTEQSGTQRNHGTGASGGDGARGDDGPHPAATSPKQGGGAGDDGAKGGGAPGADDGAGVKGGGGAGDEDLVVTAPEPADNGGAGGGEHGGHGDTGQPPAETQTQTVPPVVPTTPADPTAEPRTTTGDSGEGGGEGG
jgi:RNA polymerase sigma factor (sigma-70 family)